MAEPPVFKLFGEDLPAVDASIQPALPLRGWNDLNKAEKATIYRQLINNGWVKEQSEEILETIEYLNHKFLRRCPGPLLHAVRIKRDWNGMIENQDERQRAASNDFSMILSSEAEALVLRMLSALANNYVDNRALRYAAEARGEAERASQVNGAFKKFDRFANCLNHIFEQFCLNWRITRNGIVPMQDAKIVGEVYEPTLSALSDPKWRAVNSDLSKMFESYADREYPEAITKAHAAVQRFLQILVGEEGVNGKGEVGKLFQKAKADGLIPANRFSEQFINAVQSTIVSERATNSTAKPALTEATATDALLVMNLAMVFLQHSLSR